MAETIQFSARFEPGEEKTFQHVPFTVPGGVSQLHISIHYNDRIGSSPLLSGGNTLDVGLFDNQGTASGGPGLRGWSGSERTEITIDTHWATPPYRPGTPESGEWHLLLGAYKIGENGLTADVTVTLNSEESAPEIPPVAELGHLTKGLLPPPAEPGWYRGDLHMHTVYSDGDSYPHEVAAAVYEAGLDFYGLTDHNRAMSPAPLVPHGDGWPVLVPGVEVTTYSGHWNVWGTENWYDFRDHSAEGQQAAVNAALADGGLVSLNHPKPFGPMWEHPQVTGFHTVEPWNGWFGALNNISVGYWADALNGASKDTWQPGICGSDMHRLKDPGNLMIPFSNATLGHPTLWIQTDDHLTTESIIAAIRAGRCFISESPAGPQIYSSLDNDVVTVRVVGAREDCLMAIDSDGCIRAEAVPSMDDTFSWPVNQIIPEGEQYVRFELHSAGGGVRAISNPVWK